MNPVKFFKCLADDTRLKSLLLISELEEACVCDLVTALELDQPKISRHLAELRKCAILQDERRGKWVFYRFHELLPDWAKDTIINTAKQNPAYFKESLARLKTCGEQVNNCC